MIQAVPNTSKKSSRKKPTAPDELFAYYWQRIENAEKAIKKIEVQRATLFTSFNETLRPLEEELNEHRVHFIQHLLAFCQKKSLPKYHKQETLNWIEEEYESLVNSPFRVNINTDRLSADIIDAISDEPDQSDREQLYHMLSEMGLNQDHFTDEDVDTLFQAILEGPHAFMSTLFEMEQASDDEIDERAEDTDHRQEDFFDQPYDNEDAFFADENNTKQSNHQKKEDIFSKKAINRFYKKVAQRIHPDRVQDEAEKENYHQLMQMLTQAKKDNDIFTIFKLYQDNIAEGELLFSNDEYGELIILLKEKLTILEDKKRAFKLEPSTEAMIFDRFHAKTMKETNKRLLQYEAMLNDQIDLLISVKRRLKNIKQLKIALQERMEDREFDLMNYDRFY